MRVDSLPAHKMPAVLRRENVGAREKRSALPIHPALALTSPVTLAALLSRLQRLPEVREKLIQTVVHNHKTGVYLTRQTAQRTAHAIIYDLPIFEKSRDLQGSS